MNHKVLIFINAILWSILGTCPTTRALQSNTRTTQTGNGATTSSHWPPRVYNKNPNNNWILPAPSPFRKLSTAASLQRATNLAESPLRIERKLYPLLLHATPAAASNVMRLHNIDINPYAQSLNAELEIAFATVASYANSNRNNNNNNINNHKNILNNNNNNNMAMKLSVAATNNLNLDQSPTGADFSEAALPSFDWHRYFAMAVDNDDRSIFIQRQQQLQQQQHQLASTANAVYHSQT